MVCATPPDIMPDFFDWIRCAREHLGYSREGAARHTGVSASYIRGIEMERRLPTPEIRDKLTRGYRLSSWQRTHTLELWEPSVPLPPSADLRRSIDSPAMRLHFDHLDALEVVSAFVDPLATVLMATDEFYRLFPGIDDVEANLVRWLFGPGKDVIQHWEVEAGLAVARVRAALGRYRDAPQAHHLLRSLLYHNEFRRIMTEEPLHVAYGRPIAYPVRFRLPPAGRHAELWLQTTGDSCPAVFAIHGTVAAATLAG
ncbi:MmyB family transcriptional regulator [Nocardia sp. NPDC003482]